MLQEEIINFLKDIPPFSFLDDVDLERLIAGVQMAYYPAGTIILVQDGSPAETLGLVKKGGVKVCICDGDGAERIVDFRGVGEVYGILSLMSGDCSRANVEAVEDTISYLFAADVVKEVCEHNSRVDEYFLKSFFFNFLDKTVDEKRHGQMADSDQLLFRTKVGDVVRGDVVTAARHVSICQGAEVMVASGVSSLVIVDDVNLPVGMVTDRDLREKVVAGGCPSTDQLASIMSSSLVSVRSNEPCFAALLKMLKHNIHHIIVMDDNKLRGMVTNHDFMVFQGTSPAMQIEEISRIDTINDLQASYKSIFRTVAVLLGNGAQAHMISYVITELIDKIISRAFDLIEVSLDSLPTQYTVFIYGAGGRKELSLRPSFQLGIIYLNKDGVDSYFQELTEKFNNAFAGLIDDDFPVKIDFVRSDKGWHSVIHAPVNEGNSGLLASLLEMRPIRGNEKSVFDLQRQLFDLAIANDKFQELIATATIQNSPPLGFFNRFVVEKSGEHKDEFDLYQKGIKPMVDAVRILAISRGCRELTTARRLIFLRKEGFKMADDVSRALTYIVDSLLTGQLDQCNKGIMADDFINPDTMSNFQRKTIKESFNLINSLYQMIEERFMTERM